MQRKVPKEAECGRDPEGGAWIPDKSPAHLPRAAEQCRCGGGVSAALRTSGMTVQQLVAPTIGIITLECFDC